MRWRLVRLYTLIRYSYPVRYLCARYKSPIYPKGYVFRKERDALCGVVSGFYRYYGSYSDIVYRTTQGDVAESLMNYYKKNRGY